MNTLIGLAVAAMAAMFSSGALAQTPLVMEEFMVPAPIPASRSTCATNGRRT